MQQLLKQAGYEIVPFDTGADVYVVNTCTVTNIADRKSRQMLHKAKKMNPDAVVVATGCYAQTDTAKLKEDGAVDLILGNNQKKNIVEALSEYEEKHCKKAHIIKINQTKEYETLAIAQTAEHVRAYMKVQDGCNQFCTYCVIPYARGRVRSRKMGDILKEVHALADNGYKELVLTGIHLSSYGVDFADSEKETLLTLIRAVHQVEGIQRIRLGSLEPQIVTEEFAAGIAALPKVCPHFHLSLQSGCDRTLANMNRRYRSGEYAERCALLRRYYENPALTTDVIVGFPMETEEDFQASYDFVSGIHFMKHIFLNIPDAGVQKAAAMEGHLTETVKAKRSEKMLELHDRRAKEYENSMLGKQLELLLEEEMTIHGEAYLVGHSREYVKAAVKKREGIDVNDIVLAKAEDFLEKNLLRCSILA